MTCSRPERTAHRPGLEPRIPWSEIRHPNHCASPPPKTRYHLIKTSIPKSNQICTGCIFGHVNGVLRICTPVQICTRVQICSCLRGGAILFAPGCKFAPGSNANLFAPGCKFAPGANCARERKLYNFNTF